MPEARQILEIEFEVSELVFCTTDHDIDVFRGAFLPDLHRLEGKERPIAGWREDEGYLVGVPIAPNLHSSKELVGSFRQKLLRGFAFHDLGEFLRERFAAFLGFVKLYGAGFKDGALKERVRLGKDSEKGLTRRSCRFAEQRDAVRISSEGGDVLLNPLESLDLVENREVAGLLILFATG